MPSPRTCSKYRSSVHQLSFRLSCPAVTCGLVAIYGGFWLLQVLQGSLTASLLYAMQVVCWGPCSTSVAFTCIALVVSPTDKDQMQEAVCARMRAGHTRLSVKQASWNQICCIDPMVLSGWSRPTTLAYAHPRMWLTHHLLTEEAISHMS